MKKLLAILLALTLALTLVPTLAFAQNEDGAEPDEAIVEESKETPKEDPEGETKEEPKEEGEEETKEEPEGKLEVTGDVQAAPLLTAENTTLTGEGTAEKPYEIYNATDLKKFRDIVNGLYEQPRNPDAYAELKADIVLNDGTFDENGNYTKGASGKAADQWTPIGTQDYPYTGTFNGNGHTIKGLYVIGSVSAGLFGYTSGTIQNLAVTGYVRGKMYAGGIAGHAEDGSITGCVNLCSVLASDSDGGDVYAGGIAGYYYTNVTNSIAVKNCANLRKISASASGSCYAGGIVGQIAQGRMYNCYNVGKVTGDGNKTSIVGSIAGSSGGQTLIQRACCLDDTAVKTIGAQGNIADVLEMPKAKFADGSALALLQNGDNVAWRQTGYVAAVDMFLPLLSWQTPDTPNLTGSGTAEDPYQIHTAEGLIAFRKKVNNSGEENSVYAILMDNIVLNDGTFDENGNYTKGASGEDAKLWEPINGYAINTFDGNGKTISGLYVTGEEYAGLFKDILGCIVKNVAVTGYVEGTECAGGIVGYARSGSIEGCVNLCSVSVVGSGQVYAGGIVGKFGSMDGSTCPIQNCANWGAISANSTSSDFGAHAGGIAGGDNIPGGAAIDTIANCYSVGMVSSDSKKAYTYGICSTSRNSYYLTGTVMNDDLTRHDPDRKEKTDFAKGTGVLAELRNGDRDAWTQTGYIAAVKMIVPLLSWQKADTFPINTVEDLEAFRNMVNGGGGSAHAQLMKDIDLGSETWTPIGNEDTPYSGTFDGNGKTISGLNVTGGDYAGLFGYTDGATIQNMAVSGTVKGTKYAGGIAGYAKSGSITGCVNQCLVSAKSDSDAYAGGIAGYLTDGSAVRNCANLKAISADGSGSCYAGGIAGDMVEVNDRRPEISGCYNVGSITGTTKTGTARTGSIAGYAWGGTIANCRWLIGTAEAIAISTMSNDDDMKHAKSKAQFANGMVLDSLKGGNPDSPWTETGYLAAAGMTLPLLDWQKADDHTHNADGVLGGCTCGLLPADKGTADDPYEIKTADDLKAFRDLVNCDMFSSSKGTARCARLMNDIVLNDGSFDEDGNYTKGASGKDAEMWTPIDGYTGTFDGGGHTIKGLYVNYDKGIYSGLFGAIMCGTIQDVTVTGYVSSNSTAGGIVGEVQAAGNSVTIKNCVNYCTVRSINSNAGGYAGGIVGNLSNGTLNISDCANYGTVISNDSHAGGIVGHCSGFADEIHFQRCLNTGRVAGASSSGGIAGRIGTIKSKSSLTDCFNTGAVTGTKSNACVGGIVGGFSSTRTAAMTYCYSVGTVTAPAGGASGGLIGDLSDSNALTATNCYWLEGTADKGIVGTPRQENDVSAKSKTQFADGTVLKRLVNKRADSPWADECQYFAAAGMILPVFKGYSHTHSGGTATCKDKAVCEVCGKEYGALDPDNHVGGTELKNAKAATCTEKGYTGDTCCKGCGIKLSNGKDIPSAGHSLKHVPAKRATTFVAGNIEYWYCESCGKYFRDAAAKQEITRESTVTHKESAPVQDNKTVKSGNTGDPGVMLYVGLAALSLTGGAWLRRKKK